MSARYDRLIARGAQRAREEQEAAAESERPQRGISRDRIYPRCVWCNGENYGPAVLAYSAGEIPCASVHACGRYLPNEYRQHGGRS